jgi:uncharacterized membrane protein YeiH
VLLGAHAMGLEPWVGLLLSATIATAMRMAAIWLDWRIPPWRVVD